ncbi:HAD family hydrolase [Paenibacillus sepulcri]|uniref:HAD family hydrolase n=1 Tax=Paenibacillus sepulcri TaxID=359917 RepID=A0ABS7CBY9_9BACL|nr:HAD family hydrolase [Paenibacillus sepulcri]
MKSKYKGIAFDMDNTLLRSHIDFPLMKAETFRFLASQGILPEDFPLALHTTATLIQAAVRTSAMSAALMEEMWSTVSRHEWIGMEGAELEPGAAKLLEELHGRFHLAVVTNNACQAAHKALSDHQILHFFDHIVGREMVNSLKPSPDGFLYLLNAYPDTEPQEWLSVGDAWIDGKASEQAGMTFIAYQTELEHMNKAGVFPEGWIGHIRDILQFI